MLLVGIMRFSKRPLVAAALFASARAAAASSPGRAQVPLNHHQSSSASSGQDPFTSQFDDYVKGLLDEWKVAGLAIGVVDSGKSYTKVSKLFCAESRLRRVLTKRKQGLWICSAPQRARYC